ncbi:hypothetical protein ACH4TP_37725 [Streptomyces sp. NPDC021012]|uniref:hypothetical protein n=1 Tax=Streptomyces sp. NPDC021012 TaxID=3365107 RepID=UPI00378D7272
MRIYLTDGTRTVQLSTGRRDRTTLKAAEKTALRLLAALPGSPAEKPKTPIGFAGPLDADIERASEPEDTDETDDGDDV